MHWAKDENLAAVTLNDLCNQFEISVRTFNVCEKYELLEVPRLIDFYLKTEDFTLLQGAGRKTHEELVKICHFFLRRQNGEFAENLVPPEKVEERKRISNIAPVNLSAHQIKVLDAYVRQEFQKLSIRGQNALNHFFDYEISYSPIYRLFFLDEIPVTTLRNVGTKTLAEIETLFAGLKNYALEIVAQGDGDLVVDFLCRQLTLVLNLPTDIWEKFLPKMHERNFPIFAFLQKLILGNHLFPSNRTTIVRRRLGWFEDEGELNLEEIGLILGLTRERVRQLAVSIKIELPERFNFLTAYKTQLLELSGNYGLDLSKDLLFIRRSVANDINRKEQTNFTPKFFAEIFSLIHTDTHSLFGEQFDFFQNRYLIRRELADVYDFEAFIGDLDRQTNEHIEEDYPLDLDGYLFSFLKTTDSSTLSKVRRVCEDLIILEFGEKARMEPPHNLVLCRNKKVQLWEYAFEALENIGTPAKLDAIYLFIRKYHPDIDSTPEALRGVLTKEKSQFISFSRTSTYGLSKWESERENIRGGTIRDIVEEYLQQFSEPKHYYDITDYVLRFRPNTTYRSVHGNLQAEESGRFIEFAGGFWGVADRSYSHFRVQHLPRNTISFAKAVILNSYNPTYDTVVEYLSKGLVAQSAQIRAWLDEKLRSGTLRLENGKLIISK